MKLKISKDYRKTCKNYITIPFRLIIYLELVTITSLTKGTGNHGGPTVSNTSASLRGSRPIEIHIHNEIGEREVQRVIKNVALEDFGYHI